jgi:hypothetical protein
MRYSIHAGLRVELSASVREPSWIRDSLRQAPRLWDFVLHRSALIPNLSELALGDELPLLADDRPLMEQVQAALSPVDNVRRSPLAHDRQIWIN